MFPKRMPNYHITECKANFDAVDFDVAAGGENREHREGNVTTTRYDFNFESGQQKPSALQILKNYENASRAIGGVTMYQSSDAGIGVYKIMKSGREATWIKLEELGNDNSDAYVLTILEIEEMKQEVSSADILTALNKEGHIALYINFEIGKSLIKAESQETVNQVADMLKSQSTLNIMIEGHTDNVGSAASNQLLSDSRAQAVMNALAAKGVAKVRLSATGLGQSKPIADNSTEEGRAKNDGLRL